MPSFTEFGKLRAIKACSRNTSFLEQTSLYFCQNWWKLTNTRTLLERTLHCSTHSSQVPEVERVSLSAHNQSPAIRKQLARPNVIVPEAIQCIEWCLEYTPCLSQLEIPHFDTPLPPCVYMSNRVANGNGADDLVV